MEDDRYFAWLAFLLGIAMLAYFSVVEALEWSVSHAPIVFSLAIAFIGCWMITLYILFRILLFNNERKSRCGNVVQWWIIGIAVYLAATLFGLGDSIKLLVIIEGVISGLYFLSEMVVAVATGA